MFSHLQFSSSYQRVNTPLGSVALGEEVSWEKTDGVVMLGGWESSKRGFAVTEHHLTLFSLSFGCAAHIQDRVRHLFTLSQPSLTARTDEALFLTSL